MYIRKNDNLRDWCTHFQAYVGTTKLRTGNHKYTTWIMCLHSPVPDFSFMLLSGFMKQSLTTAQGGLPIPASVSLALRLEAGARPSSEDFTVSSILRYHYQKNGTKAAGKSIICELVTGLTLALPTLCQIAFSSALHSLEMRRRPCLFLFLWGTLFIILFLCGALCLTKKMF